MMPSPADTAKKTASPRRILRMREAVALIVGIVIGAGIFKTPAIVAGMTGNPLWMFIAWFCGGVASLIGALCYAELASTYPHAGGDYHFLQRAYGRALSFLFGWARFSVITTGSIALLAFVFGDYMNHALPLHFLTFEQGSVCYAVLAVVMLSWLNLLNVKSGMTAQTVLTVLQALCLFFIIVSALFFDPSGSTESTAALPSVGFQSPSLSAFGLAMVFVLLTYGGWNEAAYISAEIRESRHALVKALVCSILIITLLYMLITWACWRVLGIKGMAASQAVAADMMLAVLGPAAERLVSLIVALSALTSINATMIVGARTSYALGRDWSPLKVLGVWDERRNSPVNAILVQTGAALALIALGTLLGGGFKAMVEFTAPVFWLFFLLTGISLFILRHKNPGRIRPFSVPLYPLMPLIFCMTCSYMLWSSLSYVYDQSLGGMNAAWIGVAVLVIGGILFLLLRLQKHADAP